MEESLKQKTVKGTVWSTIDNLSNQLVGFVVMIFMARVLTPADYGLVGMIAIFIAISNTLINSGFSNALVRKQNRTDEDISTVFFFNIVIGVVLYLILFFCAPLIADFYDVPKLCPITRAIGLILIFNSFGLVQRALFSSKIDFKTQAKATLISAILTGAVGLSLAYTGFGVWALVVQQLANALLTSILFWIFSKWRPSFLFSWTSLKEMFGFGSKLMVSSLIETIYNNIYGLVIGKIFKQSDLGYYSRAYSFSDMGSSTLSFVFLRVSYPVLCTIQDEEERLREAYRKILKTSSFVVFPLMVGLAAVAKPFIITILTIKWEYSAFLLVPICLAQMWYPVHAINLNLLQVKGRSDLYLKLEIIKKVIGVGILAGTAPFGLYVMCWGLVLSSLISLMINTHYTGKLLNLGFIAQMKDLLPIFFLSLFMGTAVFLTLQFTTLPSVAQLGIGTVEGVMLYIVFAKLFRFSEFAELKSFIGRKKQV